VWAHLFLAWIDALVEPPHQAFLPAAVACEFMAAGYDMIDAVYDRTGDSSSHAPPELAAAVTLLLLAQETLARLELPAERRVRAGAALGRAGRHALAGQEHDAALRRSSMVKPQDVLAVLRQRSGTLVAAPCQGAALLAGAPWRTVALAGRFGRALGCAAQLEDDLADLAEDACNGRTTVPVLLTLLHPGAPDLVDATTWVLIRRYLHEAAQVLRRLSPDRFRTEALWTLLPRDLRAA